MLKTYCVMAERKMTTAEVEEHIQRQRNMDDAENFNPQFGNWEVKDDGEILYHGSEIPIKEIPAIGLENVHLTQMLCKFRGGKSDDAAEFYFAYLQALKNAGYKSMTIDLTHIHNIRFDK